MGGNAHCSNRERYEGGRNEIERDIKTEQNDRSYTTQPQIDLQKVLRIIVKRLPFYKNNWEFYLYFGDIYLQTQPLKEKFDK